jgi:hypothetical protein
MNLPSKFNQILPDFGLNGLILHYSTIIGTLEVKNQHKGLKTVESHKLLKSWQTIKVLLAHMGFSLHKLGKTLSSS